MQTDDTLEAPTEVEVEQCNQFICFIDLGLTGDEEKDRVPVGVGTTRKEAFEMGIRNALPEITKAGYHAMAQSSFAVVAQTQLSADDFGSLSKIVIDFFNGTAKLQRTEG